MSLRRIPAVAALLLCLSPGRESLAASSLPQALQPFAGHVVYVDFWASWCGPCARSFPWLNSLKARFGDRLEVVAVNVDEKRADADRFLSAHPAGFPVVYDASGQLADFYHVQGMPSAVLLDEQGHVAHEHIGFREEEVDRYEAAIRSALSQHGAGAP